MRESQRILMRSLDGELGTAEQRASSRLRAIQSERQQLEQLDRELQEFLGPQRSANEQHRQHIDAICTAVRSMPRPERSIASYGSLVAAVAVMVGAVALFGMMGSVRDLLPLGLITMITCGVGVLLLVFARQWREMEAGLVERLLRKPVPVTPTDVFSYRAVAVILVAGGIWLALG